MLYPRDSSLDPQLVWKGKDEQDANPLEVPVVEVQMIYLDPPSGIKFGSNWQVSTRKRDAKDGKVEDATRQPEQVRAFRDTWRLGIHSYLAYLRDRLTVARELLTESGSVFVQIGDETCTWCGAYSMKSSGLNGSSLRSTCRRPDRRQPTSCRLRSTTCCSTRAIENDLSTDSCTWSERPAPQRSIVMIGS